MEDPAVAPAQVGFLESVASAELSEEPFCVWRPGGVASVRFDRALTRGGVSRLWPVLHAGPLESGGRYRHLCSLFLFVSLSQHARAPSRLLTSSYDGKTTRIQSLE